MPELVILAAGMGSRYGGLKQIDPVGPNSQAILDYAIYDAIQAGFERVVFVIRRNIEADFKGFFGSRYEAHIPCAYAFQELDDLPAGFSVPPNREKPWGTGHAVWVCESIVQKPFAVINADDFYGRAAYMEMHRFLKQIDDASSGRYAMVSFVLENTISDYGSVSRGVCMVDNESRLVSVTERTTVERDSGRIRYLDEDGNWRFLTGKEPVSMNFWGFSPSVFPHLKERFSVFLEANRASPKAEYFLPLPIDHLIRTGQATITVLTSHDRWTGITNPGDKPHVVDYLKSLTQQGVYPEKLWG
jgi:UTP-glucose-1-phosphate uridylyltransferase